jgi:hypothetical protein
MMRAFLTLLTVVSFYATRPTPATVMTFTCIESSKYKFLLTLFNGDPSDCQLRSGSTPPIPRRPMPAAQRWRPVEPFQVTRGGLLQSLQKTEAGSVPSTSIRAAAESLTSPTPPADRKIRVALPSLQSRTLCRRLYHPLPIAPRHAPLSSPPALTEGASQECIDAVSMAIRSRR